MFEQPENTHLAELNIARAVDDLESDRLKDFVAALDPVNAVAERTPGFVWRLKDESGDATDIRIDDDPRVIVNLSVWETAEALEKFVWQTVHKRIYEKRSKWFERPPQTNFVMWWVPVGHEPSVDEAMARLEQLRANGPTPEAFGWESLPSVKLWRSMRCA